MLAASIPRIHRVTFKSRVVIVTVWFVDVSILEFDESFHIACTSDAGVCGGSLRIAGNIGLLISLPKKAGSGVQRLSLPQKGERAVI
jgi:hypothetical protein